MVEEIHYKKVAIAVISNDSTLTIALFGGNSIDLINKINSSKIDGIYLNELSTSELAVSLYNATDESLKVLYTAAILIRNFKINTAKIKTTTSKIEFEECLDEYYSLCKLLNEIVEGEEMTEFQVSYIISELLLSLDNQSGKFFNNFSLN